MQHRLRIGDVFMLRFEGTGSVQSGWRPGVVFQNSIGNLHSPNIVVLPLTTSLKKLAMPTHVLVRAEDSGLPRDSVVLSENPQCVSKNQIGEYVTTLPGKYIKDIAVAQILASSAIAFLDQEAVIEVWRRAVDLNKASCEPASSTVIPWPPGRSRTLRRITSSFAMCSPGARA